MLTNSSPAQAPCTTVGIDGGGPRKGFHAVALRGDAVAGQLISRAAADVADWCRSELQAELIAIDAPCRWSPDGRARPCERELMRKGIPCFSSPTRQIAYTPYPLVSHLPISGPGCFETFPHAITWHLRGGNATAARKRTERRELLQQAGLDLTLLTSIDWIDAALCALTAQHVATGGACVVHGEGEPAFLTRQ